MRRIWLALAVAACGSPETAPAAGVVVVSGASPLPANCAAGQPGGDPATGAEVEPSVAADPSDPNHLVGVWQQDRFANGGSAALISAATFDGGHTWTRSQAPFTRCTGGTFDRASDPWVTISPNGTVHWIGFSFDQTSFRKSMLAVRSTDGGKTWAPPTALQSDTEAAFAMDKETITADPEDARFVYAVWDRLTGQTTPNAPTNRGPTWFTRSTDGGLTWEAARIIFDPGDDAQTISNQIVELPGGRLADLFTLITAMGTQAPVATIAVQLSPDRGVTWGDPVHVAPAEFIGAIDPKNGKPVRSGDVVPSIAADPVSGNLYVAWEDARFSGEVRDAIAFSRSSDGGNTWSLPVQVNGMPGAQAFTPVVSVAGGAVGVSYYDLRDDTGAPNQLLAAHWLATSHDGGQTFSDARLSQPFDLQGAPIAEGYFLGDYQGLAHSGSAFLPFFVVTNPGSPSNQTDVVFRPADSPAVAFKPTLKQRLGALWARLGANRDRWRFTTTRKR